MAVRKAHAEWNGSLKEGKGSMKLGSGAFEGPFSFGTRFGDSPGTNPEELIGAAHAGCFSMAFSAMLGGAGYTPKSVKSTADVHIDPVDGGFAITRIELSMKASIPDITNEEFQTIAEEAKANCPVSRALAGTQITLNAELI